MKILCLVMSLVFLNASYGQEEKINVAPLIKQLEKVFKVGSTKTATYQFLMENGSKNKFTKLVTDKFNEALSNSKRFTPIDQDIVDKAFSKINFTEEMQLNANFYEKMNQVIYSSANAVPEIYIYGKITDNEDVIRISLKAIEATSLLIKANAKTEIEATEFTDKLLGKAITHTKKKEEPVVITKEKIVIKEVPVHVEKPIQVISENQPNVVQGLIAYYPFNGDAKDYSGNNNNATVIESSYSVDRFERPNSAMNFNGKNNYISIPSTTILKSLSQSSTICFWLYCRDTYAGWISVFAKAANGAWGQIGLEMTKDAICPNYANNKPTFKYSFPFNQWVFVAMVCNSEKASVYIDGKPIGTQTITTSIEADDYPVEIGRHTPGATEYLNAKLDDFRIYNRALSAEEITSIYQAK